VTIPRDAFAGAGFQVGDRLHAEPQGNRAVLLTRIERPTDILFGRS